MTASVDAPWQAAGARADIADGDRREVELENGELVLLVGAEGRVFACAADCPHQDSPLCDGIVQGRLLTCPLHFWQWDLNDGSPVGLAELPLRVFEIREVDGQILVRMDD
ncbi:Rieske (2Fe-2S) protein [Hansschlegelia sp. KR7-227]|uniref:Rieske (2Fe-2S) protein n=1 Tax=Hansschlegelia sp. KR7-227 TaxID=3400914 RepID=UPI003C0744FC